ncbi:Muramoyltetrapeptide carboxypeptidase LdcA (peptidoglycan recycling) [Amphibacillus marinus]|uniref:Muramoyltetrapeptide carboxypeptidase LdcA (Peptidoglycan recycling) n=1 Tax=Amphibacillus marinus TaxID=872970 RepID=A0A1H8RCF9_9BACI|nr:LD-carboxypeptidase [Amphibacillus marinus]SEO64056.1 Muramoyltetrapeptide carboxypeptidase LdcA (peptidoglycan recycling) [Amphibacillus marinus]
MLKKGDKVGFIACSDGRTANQLEQINRIEQQFVEWGLQVIRATTLFQQGQLNWLTSPRQRAQELMVLYKSRDVKAIFDLSGGDSANQILPFIDFDLIQQNPKLFFGYSDLTVLLNSIYTQANGKVFHYQLMHLEHNSGKEQLYQLLFADNCNPQFKLEWIKGNYMEGIVVGGSIRCFLKLAGTPLIPDPLNKVLFLEALSGKPSRIASYLAQLDQLGYFASINGLLLGSFTELEQESNGKATLLALIAFYADKYKLPIVKTNQLGHGTNSHILRIGYPLVLAKE